MNTAIQRKGFYPWAALILSLAGCTSRGDSVTARERTGRTVPVEDSGLPPGHSPVPVADPEANDGHVGRAPRRLSVEQLRESLHVATGHIWVARRRISDPDAPGGTTIDPQADMLEALAATLGRADYVTTTSNTLDPSVTFAKLASDAARSACRAGVEDDLRRAPGERRLIVHVQPTDTLTSNAMGVRRNLAYLALRFWGRQLDPSDSELDPLVTLFERASTAPAARDRNGTMRPAGTPADGWRAVCIAMATDPQFLTY